MTKGDLLFLPQIVTLFTSQAFQDTLSPRQVFTNAEKVDKFSKEVADYATSDDVISSVSEQIGEPKENESEEEFIERASNVLRKILKKKFEV